MTLNHGHLECINKTEKLQRKSQMAIAHAADCKNKSLIHVDRQETQQGLPLQV
jgi:hypothetical protein